MHGGTLFAQSFDVDRLQVSGDPVPIMQGIQIATEGGSGLYAVSDSGTFAYLPDQVPQSSSGPVLWMDRAGRTTTMRAAASQWNNPRFSPDGRRLALDITTNGNTDMWVYDWERDQMLKLTSDPAEERRPVWTPDGSRIVFASRRAGGTHRSCIGSAPTARPDAEPLLEGTVSRVPGSWHQNGKVLAFTEVGPGAPENLMTVTIDGDDRSGWKVGTPQPFPAAGGRQFEPMFSPDGRWIAYHSDSAGPLEVYVRSFPDTGRQWPVSTNGGQDPVWSRTSRELFYRRAVEKFRGRRRRAVRRVVSRRRTVARVRPAPARWQDSKRHAINSAQFRRASGRPTVRRCCGRTGAQCHGSTKRRRRLQLLRRGQATRTRPLNVNRRTLSTGASGSRAPRRSGPNPDSRSWRGGQTGRRRDAVAYGKQTRRSRTGTAWRRRRGDRERRQRLSGGHEQRAVGRPP